MPSRKQYKIKGNTDAKHLTVTRFKRTEDGAEYIRIQEWVVTKKDPDNPRPTRGGLTLAVELADKLSRALEHVDDLEVQVIPNQTSDANDVPLPDEKSAAAARKATKPAAKAPAKKEAPKPKPKKEVELEHDDHEWPV